MQQQQAQAAPQQQAQWVQADEACQWFFWAPTNQYWDSLNQLYYDPASQQYYDAQNNVFTAEQVAARSQGAAPQLQNLDFWCDLAKGCKDASKYIGQAADAYKVVAPVAGQVWGQVDPKSYNAYGQEYIQDGQQYSQQAAGIAGQAADITGQWNEQYGAAASAALQNLQMLGQVNCAVYPGHQSCNKLQNMQIGLVNCAVYPGHQSCNRRL
jgi:hypothetical protein